MLIRKKLRTHKNKNKTKTKYGNKNRTKNGNKNKSKKRAKTMRKKYIQKGGEGDYKVFSVNFKNIIGDVAEKFEDDEKLFAPNDENSLSNDDTKKFNYLMKCIKSAYSPYLDASINNDYANDFNKLKTIIYENKQIEYKDKILLFVSKNEDTQNHDRYENFLGCALYDLINQTNDIFIKPGLESDTTSVTDEDGVASSKIELCIKLIEREVEKMKNRQMPILDIPVASSSINLFGITDKSINSDTLNAQSALGVETNSVVDKVYDSNKMVDEKYPNKIVNENYAK